MLGDSKFLELQISNRVLQKFALTLPSSLPCTLSATECDSLVAALNIFTPGTYLSNDSFDHFVRLLGMNALRVSTPIISANKTRTAAVFAGARPLRPYRGPVPPLLESNILFGENNTITICARTEFDETYSISLQTSHPNFGLSFSDCNLVRYALLLLRPGTCIPPSAFLEEVVFFREICPQFSVQAVENPLAYSLHFHSSASKTPDELPPIVRRAVEDGVFSRYPWFNPNLQTESLQASPYPLISTGPVLRSDPTSQIFLALRRRTWCALRVLDTSHDLSYFLKYTARHLLALPPHPNLMGIADIFLEPRPAILLDGMLGDPLSMHVATIGSIRGAEMIEIAAGIARGLAFLHDSGFVHHELGLYNVYLCQEGPKIACLEFGKIDLKSTHHYDAGTKSQDDMYKKLLMEDGVYGIYKQMVQVGRECISGLQIETHMGGSVQISKGRSIPTNSLEDRIDVACFGAMLWEMWTGNQLLLNDNNKMTEQKLQTMVFSRKDMLISIAADLSDEIRSIIEDCWVENPQERAKASSVYVDLQKLVNHSATTPRNSGNINSLETSVSEIKTANTDGSLENTIEPSKEEVNNNVLERSPIRFRDRNGVEVDAFSNFERRYPDAVGSKRIDLQDALLCHKRDSLAYMNILESLSGRDLLKLEAYHFRKPGINQLRRQEGFLVLGDKIMNALDKGFSPAVDCTRIDDIFDALTTPFRDLREGFRTIAEERTHLRLVLSYRHVHPDMRTAEGWHHRQRLAENDYKVIAERVSIHAKSTGAKTVSIWTDQHFSGTQSTDSWGNNCLLPYAIYPVMFYEGGERNEERLWICAEHHLAVSGEGIISEVDELPGVWEKTKPGTVAGKLLPLSRGMVEATSNLLHGIEEKKTYHAPDRDDIIAWARYIAFFGFSKDVWKTYKLHSLSRINSEIAATTTIQAFSPTWAIYHKRPRWSDGVVVRTSDGQVVTRESGKKLWHGLWIWASNLRSCADSSEIFGTLYMELITRATVIYTTAERSIGFVFLMGSLDRVCRSCIVELYANGSSLRADSVHVLSEFQFTMLVDSLIGISCMKDRRSTDPDGQNEGLQVKEIDPLNFVREREGSPPLQLVNNVLRFIGLDEISTIARYEFLDGHEIEWI